MRMIQSSDAAHAKAYFTDALARPDYYINDQELPGFWQGRLAARLGLSGATSKEAFFALCENRHPGTTRPLTPRTKEGRTTGYDINFHCPKSVSVLHAMSGNDQILDAFRDSVSETMKLIEADAKTRVRKDGQYDDRPTGELVWAHFVHQTARPVEGFAPDPHLHSHCFVFNATWDEAEQKFKAGQFRDIKRDMPFYQAHFHKTFSDKLMNLGYRICPTDKSFEIDGVPQRVIDLFSKRTDQIGRIAKEQGITDAKELAELGARTRAKKQKGMSMDGLQEAWRGQIAAIGELDKVEPDKIPRAAIKTAPPLTPQQCVDHALLHGFERASVLPDRQIMESALRHAIGCGMSGDAITKAFRNDQRIIHVKEKSRTLCTTKEVLKEEKRMVDLARQGQGKMKPLYATAPDLTLTGQQGDAVAHVLTTSNRVSIIRGSAGTGKTTLMHEAFTHIEKAGKRITVVAPTAQASRGVLKDEGFTAADTVAKLLTDEKMQSNLKGQVLWVDEAGLLGTKDMTALLELATKNDARLILGGDTRQHASVVRGDALRILNTVAGIRAAEVSKIYRQQNEQYRAAVEDLAKGNVQAGFEKLDAIGSIQAVDPLKLSATLANDYMDVVKRGKTALIISPTHAQGEAVTKEIRERLRAEGMIGKKEYEVSRLAPLNLTEAEKQDVRNFAPGQVVQFNQNAPGFTRGSAWTVASTQRGIQVTNGTGETKLLPTMQADRYSVFEQTKLALSKGDKVRMTCNGFDSNRKRLNNGQLLNVVAIGKQGDIILKGDKSKTTFTIPRAFGHLAHAHCMTSHASQGKTVDEVLIAQPAATFPATDAKQFYVSVSRAKHRARVYTDDKEELLLHASEAGNRQSALELVGKNKAHKEIVMQKQRENYSPEWKETSSPIKSNREAYEPEI